MQFCSIIACVFLFIGASFARPSEQERVRLWKQNNKWPPEWQPETNAMQAAMSAREAEIQALTGADERWENWIQFTQSRLVPKFTPLGFKIINIPKETYNRLRDAVKIPLQNVSKLRTEGDVDVIYNNYGLHPKFIDIGQLAWQTINDLKPLHEEWWGGGDLVSWLLLMYVIYLFNYIILR